MTGAAEGDLLRAAALREINAVRRRTAHPAIGGAGARRPLGMLVNAKPQPSANDPDWLRLLDAELRWEAEMAAAQADARSRVEQARNSGAPSMPDPGALAALAAAQEQADRARHEDELGRIAGEADARMRALNRTTDSAVDALARTALAAAWTAAAAAERR